MFIRVFSQVSLNKHYALISLIKWMIKYKCKQCNKIFCDYATNYRKFCSLKCHYLSREGIPSKRRNGKSIKCKLCNKSFYVKKSIIQKNRGIFCSKQCQYPFYPAGLPVYEDWSASTALIPALLKPRPPQWRFCLN